jgi:Icc-related predicted phosphoesterase
MQITVISDTHGQHDRIKSLNKPLINEVDGAGKMIIHAGDITEDGSEAEVRDFLRWFAKLPHQYKIFIGGNHDLFLEQSSMVTIGKMIPKGVYYLNNSGLIVEGLRIWGSPVTPYFLGMAFNKKRGVEIKKVWDSIPPWTDILITHGAPAGIMDGGFGCEDLLERVKEITPQYHLFGHAHGQSGNNKVGETTFINAAMVDSPDPLEIINYKIIAEPIVFEYHPKKKKAGQGEKIVMDVGGGKNIIRKAE